MKKDLLNVMVFLGAIFAFGVSIGYSAGYQRCAANNAILSNSVSELSRMNRSLESLSKNLLFFSEQIQTSLLSHQAEFEAIAKDPLMLWVTKVPPVPDL